MGPAPLAQVAKPGSVSSLFNPVLGTEKAVDMPVSAPARASRPSVAFGPSQYLLVWNDLNTLKHTVRASLLDTNGSPVNPGGFEIHDAAATTTVTFDGTNYLVVFATDKIFAKRVSPQGVVLDTFDIAPAGQSTGRVIAVFDGTNHFLAWWPLPTQAEPEPPIRYARVTPGGVVLDQGGVPIPFAKTCQSPSLSFDGQNHLLGWVDPASDALRATRLTPAGDIVDPMGFDVSAAPMIAYCGIEIVGPSAAMAGPNHLVMWSGANVDTLGTTLVATRVSPSGAVLDPKPIELAVDWFEGDTYSRTDVASDGSGAILARSFEGYGSGEWGTVQYGRIASDGTITKPMQSIKEIGVESTLAANGSGALLAFRSWPDYANGGFGVVHRFSTVAGVRIGTGGALIDPSSRFLAEQVNSQEVRASASNGQMSLVLWTDTRAPRLDGRGLFGMLVDSSGNCIDCTAIHVTDKPVDHVAATFDGSNFVVFFNRYTKGNGNPIDAVRISTSGAVLDAEPVQMPMCKVGFTPHDFVAASNGNGTILVGNGCNISTIALAYVKIDSNLVPKVPVALASEEEFPSDPHIAWNGTNYLVAFYYEGVYGRRIDANGILLDATRLVLGEPGPGYQLTRLASDGQNHFLLWQRDNQMLAKRIDPAGQALDAQGIHIANVVDSCNNSDCFSIDPSVVHDGTNYVVAWRQAKVDDSDLSTIDSYGVAVSAAGVVEPRFVISEAPDVEGSPWLSVANGSLLAAYTRYVEDPSVRTRRAFYRTLGPMGSGGGGGIGGGIGIGGGGGIGGGIGSGGDGMGGSLGGGSEPLPSEGCDCGVSGSTSSTPLAGLLAFIGLLLRRRRKGAMAIAPLGARSHSGGRG